MESDLDLAMKVLADQRAVINQRNEEIALLNTQIEDLKQSAYQNLWRPRLSDRRVHRSEVAGR